MAHPDTDIRYIKGIGETRANALNKLGIRTLEDLLSYFPRRWEDRTLERPIRELAVGEYACVRAMLAGDPTASRISGGRTLVKVRAVDDSGALDVAFFNQDYRRTSLHKGETYIFYGKVEGDLLRRRMTNPVVEPEGRQLLTGRIMPIYPLAAGVSQTLLAKAMRQGLDACRDLLAQETPALFVAGRISTRDESDPQLVADKVLPLTEQGLETLRTPPRRDPPPRPEPPKRHRLWVRLPDKDHPAVKRIELILEMFPGDEQLVLVFEDTGRRAAARCVVHPALVEELRELAGPGNVAVTEEKSR